MKSNVLTSEIDFQKIQENIKIEKENTGQNMAIESDIYVVDDGEIIGEVSSVGTLDIESFIKTTMSLPSFRRRQGWK